MPSFRLASERYLQYGRRRRMFSTREPCLKRHPYRRFQPAHLALAEMDLPAMRADDIAGNGKAQTGALDILVAGVVQAMERPKHRLARIGGHARPVIFHCNEQVAPRLARADA